MYVSYLRAHIRATHALTHSLTRVHSPSSATAGYPTRNTHRTKSRSVVVGFRRSLAPLKKHHRSCRAAIAERRSTMLEKNPATTATLSRLPFCLVPSSKGKGPLGGSVSRTSVYVTSYTGIRCCADEKKQRARPRFRRHTQADEEKRGEQREGRTKARVAKRSRERKRERAADRVRNNESGMNTGIKERKRERERGEERSEPRDEKAGAASPRNSGCLSRSAAGVFGERQGTKRSARLSPSFTLPARIFCFCFFF